MSQEYLLSLLAKGTITKEVLNFAVTNFVVLFKLTKTTEILVQ